VAGRAAAARHDPRARAHGHTRPSRHSAKRSGRAVAYTDVITMSSHKKNGQPSRAAHHLNRTADDAHPALRPHSERRGALRLLRFGPGRATFRPVLVSAAWSVSPTDRQETITESRHGARRRGPIIVGGPLAPFAEGLRRDLAGQGYALNTVGDDVHLLANLTTQVAGEFLRERRATGRRVGVTPRGLAPVLRYLRRLQVAPPLALAAPATPLEILLAEYRRHPVGERGCPRGRSGTTCGARTGSWSCCRGRWRSRCRRCRPGRSPTTCWTGPRAGPVERSTW
jgi:hypothetical protein